jgi:hypothetical protein
MGRKLKILGGSTLCLVELVKPAYAYIDPGTGSMLVQAIIAGIAAVGVSIGVFRDRLKSFCRRIFSSEDKNGNSGDQS